VTLNGLNNVLNAVPLRKYQDWAGWWYGMRTKMMQAGAEALVTNITALLGTNGVASMQIPGLTDIGLGWKTALATFVIQFLLRILLAAAIYIQNKPDPDVVVVDPQAA
jgi:hypothetical protein